MGCSSGRGRATSWGPVVINTKTTSVLIATVLLHCGVCPSIEGCEVRKGWTIIIVSIPQRELRSTSVAAHDRFPLRCACVDSNLDAVIVGSADHFFEKGLVLGLGSPQVRLFNVQPHHGVFDTVALSVGDGSIDLGSSVATLKAWEYIQIHVAHACAVRIGHT